MTFAPPSGPPPGWYDDPWRLAPLRWWDGQAWSWQVQRQPPHPAPPAPKVPIAAGLWGLIAISGVIVALHLVAIVVASLLPVVPAVILVTLALYGPMAGYCVYASRRWASGRLSVDFGLRLRPIDAAIGLVAVLAALQAERVTLIFIEILHVPFTSNSQGISSTGHRALYVTLAAVAIIAAPVVEELFFRGLLLSSLRSRMGAVPAVGLQAVVFGAYHANPIFGFGNVGLVIILSAVGVVLGLTAHLTRRLGAGMIGHALVNALVFAVLLATN